MSGDCGHGWGYHFDGPSGPCYRCIRNDNDRLSAEVERLTARLAEAETRANELAARTHWYFGLEAEVERLRNGLKNCMLLAARHRKEIGDWQHIIRFCMDAGVQMSPLRETDAALSAGEKPAVWTNEMVADVHQKAEELLAKMRPGKIADEEKP